MLLRFICGTVALYLLFSWSFDAFMKEQALWDAQNACIRHAVSYGIERSALERIEIAEAGLYCRVKVK